jgi:signal transduction histidine kinase
MEPRSRWLFVALAVAALPLYLWAFHAQTGRTGLPAGLPDRDWGYPVRIVDGAGRVETAGSAVELRFLAQGHAPGDRVALTPAAGQPRAVALPRAHSVTLLVITGFAGLFFWIVATVVFAPRVASVGARDFFWCTLLFGLAIMVGEVHRPRGALWPGSTLSLLHVMSIATLGVLFVHLTLHFPRRHGLQDRLRWLIPALSGLAVLLIAWRGATLLAYFASPDPSHGGALGLPVGGADGVFVAEVGFGFALLFSNSRRLELARERRQIKWLLWGFAVGVTPYVFLRTLPALFGLAAPFGREFDRLLELSIPIAFSFAVARHRFLDIDIIIRRSLLYAILAALALAIYLATGLMIGPRLEGAWGRWTWVLLIGCGTIAGMLFHPLRRALGGWIDRTFFQISYSHGQALRELKRELATASSQAELATTLDRFFATPRRPRPHAVIVRAAPERAVAGDLVPERVEAALAHFDAWCAARAEAAPADAAPAGAPAEAHAAPLVAMPSSSSLAELERPDFPDAIARTGIRLIQPIGAEPDCAGLILLGEKEAERRYVEPDLALIASAAEEAARVLERITLVQAVTEETLARRRLDELDQLKNDFLSRVAHDLRTPLASLSWSTENLLDGIAGELTDAQREYLRSMKASAGHLTQLVHNLLEISRLERAPAPPELTRVELGPVFAQVIAMLAPLAADKGVEIRLVVDPACRPARGNAAKLLEVATNLIDNAVKYSPRGETVEVVVEAAAADGQSFSVRDRGPGFGASDPQRLFDRFYQGEPSPHSPKHGFGLGLYIVRAHMERMGGEISAAVRSGGGAEFCGRLPVDVGEPEAPAGVEA